MEPSDSWITYWWISILVATIPVAALLYFGYTTQKRFVDFRQLVNQRGEALRKLSRTELLAEGESAVEAFEFQGQHATVGIIVEPKDDGSLRVVVQGFISARQASRWKHVALDGFYWRPSGLIEPMPDKEFYEFD